MPSADIMNPSFVRLRNETSAVLYEPSSPMAETGVGLVVMHPNSDFQSHLSGPELARRGFRVLCVNGQYVNTRRETMIWENLPLDVEPAVEYLRQLPGIRHVVLVGHSGGGQLMPFYQNVAENGLSACRVPGRPGQGGDELAGLSPADGLVLLDAHSGYGANVLSSIDPAVTDESHPDRIDSSIDVFNSENGYDPGGSMFSEDFRRRYYRAQAERMDRLTTMALDRQAALSAGRSPYSDTEPFIVSRLGGRLWQLDVSQICRTRGAYPVLDRTGSARVEIAQSVRRPSLSPRENATYLNGAIAFTVHAFLSSHTIRTTPDYYLTEDSIEGVDWESTNTSTPANLAGVRAPLLIVAMTGHYWMVASELFYRSAGSSDKSLVFIEGASHNFTPCTACERTPGEFGDTVKTTFDHVAEWLRVRFVDR